MKPQLSLRDFIRRSTVLTQYRQFLKLAKRAASIDEAVSKDVTKQVKYQYRVHQDETSSATIAVLIRTGEEQMEMLRGFVEMDKPLENQNDTWLGQKEADGSDERGRVGEMWPWQRENND